MEEDTLTVTDILDPVHGASAGGQASCVSGFVEVTVRSPACNTRLAIGAPQSQAELTDTILRFITPGSANLAAEALTGEPAGVEATFRIFVCLYYPPHRTGDGQSRRGVKEEGGDAALLPDTVHLLTHGGTLNSSYWDIAPGGYSYADAAVASGSAVLAYDRLGSGRSDRPDPIQTVQGGVQVAIAHALAVGLRAGHITGGLSSAAEDKGEDSRADHSQDRQKKKHPFRRVLGLAHSMGSVMAAAQCARHPGDYDALALTGVSPFAGDNVPATMAAPAYVRASDGDPARFGGLSGGYVLYGTPQSSQFLFYKWPNYDQEIFDLCYAQRDTATLGEYLTAGALLSGGPATAFRAPVMVLNGDADFPFCGGNAGGSDDSSSSSNKTAALIPALFPNAAPAPRSRWHNVPGAGHNVFAHRGAAGEAFEKILEFFRDSEEAAS